MESNMHQLEAVLRHHGLTTDRIQLVKRNVFLKGRITQLLNYIEMLHTVFHEVLGHTGELSECIEKSCIDARKAMNMLKEGLD